jgi:hypothetical protein
MGGGRRERGEPKGRARGEGFAWSNLADLALWREVRVVG